MTRILRDARSRESFRSWSAALPRRFSTFRFGKNRRFKLLLDFASRKKT
jgi:hypothetical protein